jgi:CRP/FNR family transcriptional regulator, anaerobic regulatory protein
MQCGQILFQAGTTQTSLFAVRAGFLKTCAPLPNGARQIVAFHLMGDVLGLDALAAGIHRTDAIALSGCEICEIPIVNFELLMEDRLEISDHVRNLLSREIASAEEHIVTLSAMSAKQRVATFLLELSRRWRERGDSPDEFVLPMSRKEIGSYLSLTFETVSRTFSYFKSRQWISVDGKQVRIRNLEALRSQLLHAT